MKGEYSQAWRGIEALEGRVLLSLMFGADISAAAKGGGGGGGGGGAGPAIRLDLVALHELGHSLGLVHTSNGSIMDPYYNPYYDLSNFSSSDPAVATFQAQYSNDNIKSNSTAWKDSLDGDVNRVVNITYSFVPDGTAMDQGKRSTMNSVFDAQFKSDSWKQIFVDALSRWAGVSNGNVVFSAWGDNGSAFNASGLVQHDPRFGDIRIGAHRFDGVGKTLAHTYYPPPNGATAAGDSHYDDAENWVAGTSTTVAAQTTTVFAIQTAISASGEVRASDSVVVGDSVGVFGKAEDVF